MLVHMLIILSRLLQNARTYLGSTGEGVVAIGAAIGVGEECQVTDMHPIEPEAGEPLVLLV